MSPARKPTRKPAGDPRRGASKERGQAISRQVEERLSKALGTPLAEVSLKGCSEWLREALQTIRSPHLARVWQEMCGGEPSLAAAAIAASKIRRVMGLEELNIDEVWRVAAELPGKRDRTRRLILELVPPLRHHRCHPTELLSLEQAGRAYDSLQMALSRQLRDLLDDGHIDFGEPFWFGAQGAQPGRAATPSFRATLVKEKESVGDTMDVELLVSSQGQLRLVECWYYTSKRQKARAKRDRISWIDIDLRSHQVDLQFAGGELSLPQQVLANARSLQRLTGLEVSAPEGRKHIPPRWVSLGHQLERCLRLCPAPDDYPSEQFEMQAGGEVELVTALGAERWLRLTDDEELLVIDRDGNLVELEEFDPQDQHERVRELSQGVSLTGFDSDEQCYEAIVDGQAALRLNELSRAAWRARRLAMLDLGPDQESRAVARLS